MGWVTADGRVTRGEAAVLCALGSDQSKRILSSMEKKGLLSLQGRGRGAFYGPAHRNRAIVQFYWIRPIFPRTPGSAAALRPTEPNAKGAGPRDLQGVQTPGRGELPDRRRVAASGAREVHPAWGPSTPQEWIEDQALFPRNEITEIEDARTRRVLRGGR
jgi:hypothetical protein